MVKAAEKNYKCLYICINKKFPIKRLENFIFGKSFLYKNMHIEEIKDLNQFNNYYTNIQAIIFEKEINFIFLDDIASLIETEFYDENNKFDYYKKKTFLKKYIKI